MRKKDPEKVDMGLRFRKAREHKGWTREVLAEKSELSVSFLADLESGNTGIRLDRFRMLCKLLDTTADYILYGEPSPSAQTIAGLLTGRDERTQRLVESTVRAMLTALDEPQP